jgi:hypothetical protein
VSLRVRAQEIAQLTGRSLEAPTFFEKYDDNDLAASIQEVSQYISVS